MESKDMLLTLGGDLLLMALGGRLLMALGGRLLMALGGRLAKNSGVGELLLLADGVRAGTTKVDFGFADANCWNCLMRCDTLPPPLPTVTFFAIAGLVSVRAFLRNGPDTERAVSTTGVSSGATVDDRSTRFRAFGGGIDPTSDDDLRSTAWWMLLPAAGT